MIRILRRARRRWCWHAGRTRYYGKRDVAVTGSAEDAREIARSLYALLRGADEDGYSRIYFEGIPKAGIGFAVMNRVYKAAAYNIVKV